MGRMVEISGLGMPGLEPYAGLTNAQLRSVRQGGQSVFIAESLKVIGYALSAGCRPLSLLVNRKNLASAAGLIGRCGDIDVYVGDDAILTNITGFELSRGVLCAMERPETVRLVPGKPAVWRYSREWWTRRTSAPSSAPPRRWAWTRCCSRPAAVTRSTGGRCV